MDRLDAEGPSNPHPPKKRPHLKPSPSMTHWRQLKAGGQTQDAVGTKGKTRPLTDKMIYGYVSRQTDGQTQDAVGTKRKTRPLTDKVIYGYVSRQMDKHRMLSAPQKKRDLRQTKWSMDMSQDRWTKTGSCRHQKKNETSDKVIYGYVSRQTDGQTQEAVGTRRKTRPLTDRQSALRMDGQTTWGVLWCIRAVSRKWRRSLQRLLG